MGPTNAIRRGLLHAKQAEAEGLRGVLAAVQARNAEAQAQLVERRRQAQELLAKTQVRGLGGLPAAQRGTPPYHAVLLGMPLDAVPWPARRPPSSRSTARRCGAAHCGAAGRAARAQQSVEQPRGGAGGLRGCGWRAAPAATCAARVPP